MIPKLIDRLLPQYQQILEDKKYNYKSIVSGVIVDLSVHSTVGDLPYRTICEMQFLFNHISSPFELFEELSL